MEPKFWSTKPGLFRIFICLFGWLVGFCCLLLLFCLLSYSCKFPWPWALNILHVCKIIITWKMPGSESSLSWAVTVSSCCRLWALVQPDLGKHSPQHPREKGITRIRGGALFSSSVLAAGFSFCVLEPSIAKISPSRYSCCCLHSKS